MSALSTIERANLVRLLEARLVDDAIGALSNLFNLLISVNHGAGGVDGRMQDKAVTKVSVLALFGPPI